MFNMVDFTLLCLEQPFFELTTDNARALRSGPLIHLEGCEDGSFPKTVIAMTYPL